MKNKNIYFNNIQYVRSLAVILTVLFMIILI